MAGAKIALSSTTGELRTDGNDNARVNLPLTATQAGYVQQAYVPATGISKIAKVSEHNQVYSAEARQLFDLDFNSAATAWHVKIGTNATTMTKGVQNGFMRLNNSAITTTTTGISIYSRRVFNIESGYEYIVKFQLRHTNATATNKQAEFGLGYYIFAAGQANQMLEFIGFRFTTAGALNAVVSTTTGGTPSEQESALAGFPASDSVSREYMMIITDTTVEFWIDDVYQTRLSRPSGSYGVIKSVSYPFIARVFNSGAASAAATFDIADISIMKIGADDGMPHSYRMSAMGKSTNYVQPDVIASALDPHVWPASGTAPTAAAGSNTASAANNTAYMGGLVRNTLTGVTATLSTNVLWTAFLNPAVPQSAGAPNNARNLYVTGIFISPQVVTTALTGGGFTAVWFAAIGSTALSLATADADGTTAVAQRAPRFIPLPKVTTLAAAAALGTVSTDVGDYQFYFDTPLVVHPGEHLEIGFRTLAVTAAVTVGTADCAIYVNGYWD